MHRTRDSTAVAELSPTQVSILGRLGRNGALSSADLAKSERLKPQTIRNLVDGLRTRGLVVGVRDSVDARRNMFALTTEGRGWVRGRRATAADRVLTRVLTEQLSETELATVTEALSLLERLAFAPPDPPSTHRDTLTG
ncbi:MarR family winged helix-turn-helix transcriptional regulator [Nocardia sp. CC201C]|uniref:MarR family winged helix-turn-helix transcriptional regulator n=1 Tax=Nocardia sp. CC201C TaxID=3044575 RepID=UPI0024A9DBEA|nr:MarR family winged helix-turn-helix transcriptional regulator [Nocardia sp. CC201C]